MYSLTCHSIYDIFKSDLKWWQSEKSEFDVIFGVESLIENLSAVNRHFIYILSQIFQNTESAIT